MHLTLFRPRDLSGYRSGGGSPMPQQPGSCKRTGYTAPKRHLKGAKKAITSFIRRARNHVAARTGRLLSSLRCGTQLEARRSLRKRPFKCDTLRSCTCGACLRGIQRSEPLESKQNARNVTPPPSDGDSPAFTNREDPRPQLPGSDAQGLAECPGTSQEDCLTCLHSLHVFKV